MLDIEKLSKEAVYDIMFQQVYVLNLGFYKIEDLVRASHPELLKSDKYLHIMKEMGIREAKGVAKVLGILSNGIDSLIQLLQCSHWAVFETFEIKKLTEQSCRMRIIDCSAQKAAQKWGMEYYECADVTHEYLRGFCDQINRKVSVRKVFAPPEVGPKAIPVPDNVSCEWVISIE